jgi:hypothetical protein
MHHRCALLIVAGLLAGGCGTNRNELAGKPGAEPVAAGIEYMGGLEQWRKVDTVLASAVITTFGQAPASERARVRFDVWDDELTAVQNPGGQWTVTADDDGCRSSGAFASDAQRQRLCEAIAFFAARLRGPLVLCGGKLTTGQPQRVWVEGMDLVRVPVTGGSEKAFYFSAADGALRLVTAGGDEPGQAGTVTIYTYDEVAGGMMFPRKLRVVSIGELTLIGAKPLMEIDLSNLKFSR